MFISGSQTVPVVDAPENGGYPVDLHKAGCFADNSVAEFIELPDGVGIYQIQLFNGMGQQIFTTRTNENILSIDLNNLKSAGGILLVEVLNERTGQAVGSNFITFALLFKSTMGNAI